jgi:hypothetical protein
MIPTLAFPTVETAEKSQHKTQQAPTQVLNTDVGGGKPLCNCAHFYGHPVWVGT